MSIRIAATKLLLVAAVCLNSLDLAAAHTAAEGQSLPADFKWTENVGGNLCGVYSAARALKLVGLDAPIESFWSTDFVGHASGSTPEELVAAVQDAGAHAVVASNLTCLDLQVLAGPMIANVRSSEDRNAYDHWVCVVADGNKMVIYDGPRDGKAVTKAEFLAQWNGVGLVVSRSKWVWLQVAGLRLFTMCIFVGFGIALISVLRSSNIKFSLVIQLAKFSAALGIILFVGGFLFGYKVFGTTHEQATATAIAPFVNFSPIECELEELEMARSISDTLLVDARLIKDYARGSIDTAVNIPVTAQYEEIREYTSSLPRKTKIFVFCHSATCAYDTVIARRLSSLGFTDVHVCSGGYVEYINRGTGSAN